VTSEKLENTSLKLSDVDYIEQRNRPTYYGKHAMITQNVGRIRRKDCFGKVVSQTRGAL